ncbi:VOC family protein [Streptomyces inhibens]|uniref:VOC family protein n=1 Tax=Streptomyces inhibens TaxID=2293571 RepID=UPI0036B54E91
MWSSWSAAILSSWARSGALSWRPPRAGADGVNISPQGEGGMRLYLVERASGRPRSRTRLWLNPVVGSLEAEVARLTGLGATVVDRRWTNRSCGPAVVVLADPEGNEFCIESSDREVAEAQRRLEDPLDGLDGLGPGPEAGPSASSASTPR